MITKRADNPTNYLRRIISFQSAREAFGAILHALDFAVFPGKVLLPAYIGWSPREGSGVFDPIASLGLDYEFYPLDARLRIDLASLRTALQAGNIRVLVIIHYFGYVDPLFHEAVRLARAYGVLIVEDEAHALLSDIIAGLCGREGDMSIYSFHKLLPLAAGGAAVINNPQSLMGKTIGAAHDCGGSQWWQFDLHAIAAKRTANAVALDQMVRELAPGVEPLWGPPSGGEIPQSYPVLVRHGTRDCLYHEMNAAGFGVVSLYHTLIPQIPANRFPQTHDISRSILNLPVHQDISEEALETMVGTLARLVNEH